MQKTLVLLTALAVFTLSSSAQDIFNKENSFDFGKYLFHNGQYEQAAKEFERVIFFDTVTSPDVQKFLLLSYIKAEKPGAGINWINNNYGKIALNEKNINALHIDLLILDNRFYKAKKNIIAGDFGEKYQKEQLIKLYIFDREWDSAKALLHATEKLRREPGGLLTDIENQKFKKPWKAAALSTVIPGLGKVYSGAWKDGLFSFIMVATTGYQAYRWFRRDGTSSVLGWIYGGISFGFYSGNIYGSYNAAKQHNEVTEDKILSRAHRYYFNNY